VDEMVTRYEAWSEDAAAVASAYSRWSEARAGEEVERFSAYIAALDQEQASAQAYARAVSDVERWTPSRSARVAAPDE
jgi:hypothetical protein